MILWISCSLSFAGCSRHPPEPIDITDSTRCTTDCISVTKGFVLARFAAEERIVRLLAAMKACEERTH